MDKVIGIKNNNRVKLTIHFKKPLEHPFKGKALPLFRIIKALMNAGSGLACDVRSMVRTIVGYDKNLVHGIRIAKHAKIFH